MKKLISTICLVGTFAFVAGCGNDDKVIKPSGVDGELKPLATPGSPGGSGGGGGGKKAPAPGGGPSAAP